MTTTVTVTDNAITVDIEQSGINTVTAASDTEFTSPADEDLVAYDDASSKWVNKTKSELDIASAAALAAMTGTNVKTVGDGGNFTTIELALAWMEAQTPETTPGGEAGSVILQAGTANFIGIATDFTILQTGDFIRVTDDTAGSYYPLYGEPDGQAVAWSVCGFTSSVSIKAWTIHRPNRYSLLLLPGTHNLTGNYTIPEGMDLTIGGYGKGATQILINPGNANTIPLEFPNRGRVTLENMSINVRDESGVAWPAMGTLEAAKPTTFSVVRLSNLALDGKKDVTFLNTWSAGIYADHVTSKRVKFRVGGDLLEFTSVSCDRHESTDCFLINGAAGSRNLTDIARQVVVRDSDFFDTRFGSGSVFENNSNFVDAKILKFINCSFDTEKSQSGTENFRTSGGTTYLTDCTFDSANDYDINNTGGNGPVYMSSCRNKNGGRVRIADTMDVTALYQVNPALGVDTLTITTNTITPNGNSAKTFDMAALTAGLTINAPVNPISGQTLALLFTQDGTGSHALTFNAIFKVHTNPTGGVSQIVRYEFEYNGTNWIQTNQPVWV